MKFLLNAWTDAIPLIILVVLLIALLVISFLRRKKYGQQMDKMQSDLKKGDEIVTYSGIIGKIDEIRDDEKSGRSLLIKSGHGDKTSYIKIDSKAIYGLLNPPTNAELSTNTDTTTVDAQSALPDPQSKKRPKK